MNLFDRDFYTNLYKFNSWKKWGFALTSFLIYAFLSNYIFDLSNSFLKSFFGFCSFVLGAAISGELDKTSSSQTLKIQEQPISRTCKNCNYQLKVFEITCPMCRSRNEKKSNVVQMVDKKFCRACGSWLPPISEICSNCNSEQFVYMNVPLNTYQVPVKEKENSEELKNCPFCAELIKKIAIKCRYCGELLPN